MKSIQGNPLPTTVMGGYPCRYETRIALKNGTEIFLRPILPTDAHLLIDLFNKMSPLSRYLRFLSHHQELSEELLHGFTHINYDSEFALVGVIKEEENDAIIAVGRYTLDPTANSADLALAVRDDCQHLGLGTAVLARIIDIGKDHGVFRFGSMMDPQNSIVKKVLWKLGYDVTYYFRNGTYQVEIVVPGP